VTCRPCRSRLAQFPRLPRSATPKQRPFQHPHSSCRACLTSVLVVLWPPSASATCGTSAAVARGTSAAAARKAPATAPKRTPGQDRALTLASAALAGGGQWTNCHNCERGSRGKWARRLRQGLKWPQSRWWWRLGKHSREPSHSWGSGLVRFSSLSVGEGKLLQAIDVS
jgi:hypothetical protein